MKINITSEVSKIKKSDDYLLTTQFPPPKTPNNALIPTPKNPPYPKKLHPTTITPKITL